MIQSSLPKAQDDLLRGASSSAVARETDGNNAQGLLTSREMQIVVPIRKM